MEVKKAIKKIVALGAGVSMMGATLFGAMAADLSAYPAPFIKDGVFDALIVVGESAATNDVLGAIDISNNLQASHTKESVVSTDSAAVTISGDSRKVESGGNNLELNNELADSILSSITGSDLKALADGSVDNEHGTHKFTQRVDVGKMKVEYALDPDDETDTPTEYLTFPSDSKAYEYKISFTPALKSDHNTAGTDYLDDIKNKKIKLLGQQYTILGAEHSGIDKIKLTFMAGATQEILDEGASKTFTVEGTEYDVTVSIVTTSEAKFVVNGESTDSLTEGETYRLNDGTEVGVIDILENEAGEAAGGDKVEFTLGANKIVIKDTNTSLANYGATVTIGTEDLGNVNADIVVSSDGGTTDGNDVKISDIKIRYNSSQKLYVAKDRSLSVVADEIEDETGNVFTNAFDIEFKGFEVGVTDEVKLKPSGSNNYKMEWSNKNGQKYNLDTFAYMSSYPSGQTVQIGKLSGSTLRPIHRIEAAAVADEEYFVVTKNGYSHIMQYKSLETSNDLVKINDAAIGGSTYEVTYTPDATNNGQGDLNLDGNTFKINVSEGTSKIYVDMNGDADFLDTVADGTPNGGVTNDCTGTPDSSSSEGLVTEHGACLSFVITPSTVGTANATVYLVTEKTEDTEYNLTAIEIKYDSSNSQLDINGTARLNWDWGGTSGLQIGSSDDYEYYDGYGTRGHWFKASSAADTFTWTYPDNQVLGAVFYTSGMTETVGSSGDVTTTEVVKIDVGSAVLDTDPLVDGKETSKNLIVVGGPAINKAAAVLMGVPFPSYGAASGVPENAAIVKLVENGGNVAMVVAGWTAEDSQRAARVVAQHDQYTGFKGKEIKVTGTTLADMKIGAITAEEDTTAAE